MTQNITFRTQLIGGVSEFCHDSKLSLLANALNLVELIVLLARYQEEGVSLCPKVYITNDLSTLNAMLPDGESLKIGTTTPNIDGIKQALKKCAPLAISGWLIYLQETETNIEYGLFKGSGNPISVLVDDVLMSNNDDFFVVKAYQVADDCVEIRSNNGTYHYVFLNHRKENSPPPLQYLDDLVKEITKDVTDEYSEPTNGLLHRFFFDALRQSHGCIIAVTGEDAVPKFIAEDGVILDKAINFAELVSQLKKGEISASRIDSKGYLLQGMLNSDGIILFNNKAQLLGYNCFIKVENDDAVIGGARKRAFSTIKSQIGIDISAVFMQSQDGWTDFKGETND